MLDTFNISHFVNVSGVVQILMIYFFRINLPVFVTYMMRFAELISPFITVGRMNLTCLPKKGMTKYQLNIFHYRKSNQSSLLSINAIFSK